MQGKSLKIADTRLEHKTGSIDALTFVKVKTWTRNMIMSKKHPCQSGIVQFFVNIVRNNVDIYTLQLLYCNGWKRESLFE